jgi:hypothetical protein
MQTRLDVPDFATLCLALPFLLLVLCSGPAGAAEDRKVYGNGEVVIKDLDQAVDPRLLQKSPAETNLWKAVPYECDQWSGVMLAEGGGTKLQPITVRLRAAGTYRVFMGLYGGYDAQQLRVKLSNDAEFTNLPITTTVCRTLVVAETFWKEADLSGQDLVLESVGDPARPPGALAYIRLEPRPARKDIYPLAITNDGNGVFFGPEPTQPQDLLKPFEAIPADSCMRILFWGNGCADNCNYPTKVGQFYPNAGLDKLWQSDFCRNMGILKTKGWNSMELVRDYARQRQWEFQVYIRMEAFKAPFPFDDQEDSKFYNEHPECRCLDREGTVVGRLSYAYPEVQKYMLRLIREIADYGPDGVCLCFIRGLPVVLYEPIMVAGFKKRYGCDPRQLDELDPRWLDYQGAVMTSFIRKVRKTLEPGQRLSVIVPGNEKDCRHWGLDVATWVKEGIINDLLPTGQRFDATDVHRDDPDNLDFPYFARLRGRQNIRLMPLLYPWTKYSEDFAGWEKLVRSYLDQGADAYAVWDATVEAVGHIGKTMGEYQSPPPPAVREIKLKTINGMRLDRYHYFEVI